MVVKKARTKDKLLHEFMEKEVIAPWIRALSDNQLKSLLQLSVALRDDMEQGTCYRVRNILMSIGINPIMGTKLLRKMIVQSRGNDIAFLYFILEGYYKSDDNAAAGYTLNEKYIMTSITQLDLPFTIAALDRILPQPLPRPKNVEADNKSQKMHKSREQFWRPSTMSRHLMSVWQKPKKLPYFQKLQRPKVRKSNFRCPKPDFRVDTAFFKRVGDMVVRRKEDRWFADYELQPSLRVVKRAINSAVNQLFDNCSINLPKLEEKNLCLQHKFMAAEAQDIKDALMVAARDRCLSIIDTSAHKDQARLRRILQQLNDDIDWHTAKYKEITRLQLTDIKKIYRNCGNDCEMCDALVSTLAEQHDMRVMYWDKDVERYATEPTNNIKTLSGPNVILKNVPDAETTQKPLRCPKRSRTICRMGKSKVTRLVDGSRVSDSSERKLCKKAKQKEEEMPFKATTLHKPYAFDYMRILPIRKQSSGMDIIQSACLNALRRPQIDIDKLAEPAPICQIDSRERCQTYRPGEKMKVEKNMSKHNLAPEWSLSYDGPDTYANKKAKVLDEVVECAKRIVMQKLEQRRIEDQQKEAKMRLAAEGQSKADQLSVLKYENVDYFDPNNDELMVRLLKDGLNVLKKDRRYVLATFPEVYKLRLLREWVKSRYGKIYSQKDIDKSFKTTNTIFRAVMHLQKKTPKVELLDMPTGTTTFSKINEIKKMGKLVTKRYYETVNNDLMQQTAFCWFAMGAYLWARGSPKTLFYSYLPATVGDIQRARPWR